MECFIDNSITELDNILHILKNMKDNRKAINSLDKVSRYNFNIKLMCFSNNIDILKHNILSLLEHFDKNDFKLSNTILEQVREEKKYL